MVRKRAEKELYWREMVNRQAASGMSVAKFCAKQGISQPSFYTWRKKLRNGDEESTSGLEPRQRRGKAATSDNGREFIPLRLQDSASAMEIIHPLGYRIRVTGEVDCRTLRQVFEALDGGGNG